MDFNTVSFPKLGWEFTVNSDAFTIFGFTIKWYAIMITLGILCAILYCFRRMRSYGLDSDRAVDVVFFGLIGGVVGARLYYVIMEWDIYKDNISDIFAIRDGGLAIYGGIIGALIIGFIVAKIRKVHFVTILDIASMGFLIGQAFGRWGNFFNHECFGDNTNLPWGMTGPRIQAYLEANAQKILDTTGIIVDPSVPVHPTFFYESLWCFIGFVILHFYSKKRKFDGELFLFYIAWYGIGRFFFEGLRTDSLMIGHFRVSQVLAAVSAVVALVAVIIIRRKVRLDGDYVFYKDTEESKELLRLADEKIALEEEKKNKRKHKTAEAEVKTEEAEDVLNNNEKDDNPKEEDKKDIVQEDTVDGKDN